MHTIQDRAFSSNQLKTVYIADNVSWIGNEAFANNSITTANLPEKIKEIGEGLFRDNLLTNISIPGSVAIIGSDAFSSNKLTNIVIPESVTSIGSEALKNNTLTSITIPHSVVYVGKGAFIDNPLAKVNVPLGLDTNGIFSDKVSITINNKPTFSGTSAVLADGQTSSSYKIRLNDLLKGYSDIDGDVLSITGLTSTHGLLNHNEDGSWTLTTTEDEAGRVGLSYSVLDGKGGSIDAANSIYFQSTPKDEFNPYAINRLYNAKQGKHLFSSNQIEIDILTGTGWQNEGTVYFAPQEPTADVFRFYISSEKRHFYTALELERDLIINNKNLTDSGWQYEGKVFSAYSTSDFPENAIGVVRYLNQGTGSHLYSTSTYEQSLLDQDANWLNEGIAWYGNPMT